MLTYAKAVVAALIAGLTALSQALVDGTLTTQDWVIVALAFFAALAAVWAVPNKTGGT